jgi:hypothetical protein
MGWAAVKSMLGTPVTTRPSIVGMLYEREHGESSL